MRIELFHEIGSSLRNNKLRTALTGFAVSWGLFLLITLLGATNGLMNSFLGSMENYVSQSVEVRGVRTTLPYKGFKEKRRIKLDSKDKEYTKGPEWQNYFENINLSSSSTTVAVSLNGNTVNGWLTGVMPLYAEIEKMQMVAGRFINPADLDEHRKVIVLTSTQAQELKPGKPEDILGTWVKVNGIAFRVIGIYHADESSYQRTVPIPYTTYKAVYDPSDYIQTISFNIKGERSLKEHYKLNQAYTDRLKQRHSVHPEDPMGIWVNNGYLQNKAMNKAAQILRIAMWILGILTLVSGIVGVSNIMLITVKERTHEFGIRKAIGAKPSAILRLIIGESIVITTLFGYVGMFMGMVACQIMDKTVGQESVNIGFDEIHMLLNPTVGLDIAIEATILLILAGSLAGAIPAWKAARVKPIEALRAE